MYFVYPQSFRVDTVLELAKEEENIESKQKIVGNHPHKQASFILLQW
jgi:hypothetical protein